MRIDTLADLGRLVRERRRQLGLSQVQLARRAGLSQTVISLLERGIQTELGLRKALRLLSVLGLALEAGPARQQAEPDAPTLDDLIEENRRGQASAAADAPSLE